MTMFKKLSTKLWAIAVTLMMVLSVTVTGFAAAGDVPAHNKRLTNNNDGTYKLSLDIKGETETYVNKVNVLVILDTSTSMTQQTGGQQRITAAKNAINSMANQLLGLNGQGENPNDAVEMALLRFGTTASVVQQPTTSRTGFTNAVNNIQVQQNQGTNWEDAMQDAANNITFDSDRTFVIFVSDGNPTFRNTRGNYNPMDQYYYNTYGVYGNGSDSQTVGGIPAATTIARCYDHAKDDAASLAQKYGVDNFYTIGAYGDVSRMESLTTDAGAPANHYFSATNTAELNNALESIIEDIRRAGIGDAQINDPTTANVTATSGEVSHLLTVDETSFKYYKNGQEWADAPAASVVNGEVVWDLGDGLLDDGVTYTVTFDCWPSQETYDLIADLNNGKVSYDSLDANIKQYLIKNGDSYTLLTNKNPSITYTDTRTDDGPQTVGYDNPPPVATDVERMSIEKLWENALDTRKGEPVTLKVKRDENENYDTITLNEGNDWKSSTYIATGLMRANLQAGTVEILETGHDYRLIETGNASYYWDFFTETVHPMVINGVETKLVEVEDEADIPAGMSGKDCYNDGTNSYYRFNGKVYISKGTESTLQAENHRRSYIDVTKEISEGADKAPADAMFEYTFSVDDAKSDDGQVWFSVVDENGELVKDLTTNATAETSGGQNTGYYHAANGSNITFEMKAGWNMRILNLPNGAEFSIEETDMPANFVFDKITVTPEEGDYTVSGQKVTGTVDTSNTDFKFKYANKYEGTEVPVEKIWDDNNNQDGIRPEKVTVNLLADGEKVKSQDIEVADDGTWKYTFKDLPKYNDDKTEIVYTVTEEAVPNYTTTITGNATDGFKITNAHEPEETDVTVKKVWDDKDNQDGKRPSSISVTLTNNANSEKKTVTLNDDNEWTETVENLPKYYDEGKEIVYTWTEDTEGLPEGYSLTDTSVDGKVTTITNSYEPGKVSRQVLKVWDDSDNIEGFRPESITVQLYADGEKYGDAVTLSDANEWSYNWTGLDEYKGGKLIEYTVEESDIPEEYTSTKVVDGTLTTITNTREVEYTKTGVKKEWNDANNQDGKRPEKITVVLSDEKTDTEYTLDADNNWSETVDKLIKYRDGKEIEYTWTEVESDLPDGYELTATDVNTETGITTFTNSYTPETVDVTVKKVWDDANNQDGIRPGELTVTLNNGTEVTLKDANNWEATIEGLPKYADGEVIDYKWVEDIPEGYELINTEVSGYVTTFTNKHTPELTEVSVEKVWDDNNNQDGKRPGTLTVTLTGGEEDVDVELSADNSWKATVDELPKYKDGEEIEYAWDEKSVPDGYTLLDPVTEGKLTTLTNQHIPATVTVTVSKQWTDADDQDGYRPSSISVALLADETEKDSVTLSDDNNWTKTWTGLDKYAEGKVIAYTVQEGDIPSEYEVTVTKTTDTETAVAYTVNNSHKTDKTSMSVEKIWNDEDDKAKLRPTSVDVQLSDSDGNKYDKDGKLVEGAAEDYVSVTLSADNNWKYTWETLEKKRAGKEIEYSVDEVGVPKGYIKTKDGAAITNTHENTTYSVKKTWNDDQNRDGIRPSSISVQLYANGKAEGDTVTLNASNDWSYTWDILPKKDDDGKDITYTADETAVPDDYTKDVTHSDTQSLIINTHNPAKDEVVVQKVWNDEEDLAGLRPSSIKVQLKRNGKNYGDPVTLNEDNDWTHKWSDLLVNSDGQKITYTVDEVSVPKGYIKTVTNEGNFYVITNTHENTSFQVNKVWDDADDQDGKRPSSIKVELKRNGTTIDTVTLNEGNNWQKNWPVLPKKDDDGNEYSYSADETAVPVDYEKSVAATETSATITNKHDPSQTTVDVLKQWVDDDDRDRIRPESVSVVLLADGKQVGDAVELNADNNWANTWADLDEYSKGKKIDYTVKEENVPEGYSVKVVKTGEGFAYTVVNTHETKKRDISVEKKWDDAGNQDGLRPDSVMVQLYANGDKFGKEVELNEKNDWKHTWKNLNYYEAGEEIEYTVEEVEVPEKYEATTSGDMDGGFKIVNKHEPAKTKVSGTKTWDDNNDKLKKRPDSIIVNLYADGKYKTSITVKPDKDGNWKYTFDDLDKFRKEGKKIKYTVTEDKVEGYKKPIIKGYDITNPIKPEKPVIPVTGDPTTLVSLLMLLAAVAVLVPVTRRRKNQ